MNIAATDFGSAKRCAIACALQQSHAADWTGVFRRIIHDFADWDGFFSFCFFCFLFFLFRFRFFVWNATANFAQFAIRGYAPASDVSTRPQRKGWWRCVCVNTFITHSQYDSCQSHSWIWKLLWIGLKLGKKKIWLAVCIGPQTLLSNFGLPSTSVDKQSSSHENRPCMSHFVARRAAFQEMLAFVMDRSIRWAHKWGEVGSAICACFLVLATLHCCCRLQDGRNRAVDTGVGICVDDFKIKQQLRLCIPHSSGRQITHQATSVAGSSPLLPHNWLRCYMTVRHGSQLPCDVTHFIVAAYDPSKVWAIEAVAPRFSAAGMVCMKNHEKSEWVYLIWNPGQVLIAGCGKTPGRARTFNSDQSKAISQDRERRRKLHRCIQTAIDSARRDWSSARRDWRLFFQTFQPSFVISWPISTNEPSLESLKSQQGDGANFVPVSPREQTIAPFLRRVLTLSAQFPRIRTCSGQINLYRGEIAVWSSEKLFPQPSHIPGRANRGLLYGKARPSRNSPAERTVSFFSLGMAENHRAYAGWEVLYSPRAPLRSLSKSGHAGIKLSQGFVRLARLRLCTVTSVEDGLAVGCDVKFFSASVRKCQVCCGLTRHFVRSGRRHTGFGHSQSGELDWQLKHPAFSWAYFTAKQLWQKPSEIASSNGERVGPHSGATRWMKFQSCDKDFVTAA